MALYARLLQSGIEVSLVTYGDAADVRLARRWPGIRVLCNRWRLPRERYERLLPWLHAWTLWRSDLFRTNQVDGAEVALWAARRWRKPTVARCGYLKSLFDENDYGVESPQARWARTLEARVFGGAAAVEVTTELMRNEVSARYGIPASRIEVVPNYVDTDLFRPMPEAVVRPRSLLFVGRLHEEKNPLSLVDALSGLDAWLTMVGTGPLEGEVRARLAAVGARGEVVGNVAHERLPELLNSAEVFVQPSRIEGHPKTIIEAMSCGRPVLASDIPGNREVVQDGVNGCLCGLSAREIGAGIRTLLASRQLREKIGVAARQSVVERFSLTRVAAAEAGFLRRTATQGHRG
jgi:glycosyltransferase involved in cell wall biosynthesis